MLQVYCHLSVRKAQQSNLTRNSDINTMSLAKIPTVASWLEISEIVTQ